MSKWEEIRSNVSRAADKTVKVTGEIAGNASMHVKLAHLNSKRDEQFEKLGRLTYKQLKTDTTYAEEIAAIIAQIDTLGVQISKQKAKIEEAKAKKAAEKAVRKEEKQAAKAREAAAEAEAQQACANELKDIIDEGMNS